MRHQRREHRLGRTSAHYEATRRNLVNSLFRHGRVRTTLAKAKAFKAFAEKMITLAKQNLELELGKAPTDRDERRAWVAANRPGVARGVHNIRRAVSYLHEKDIVKVLFDEIAPRFKDRPGGYTRIIKLSHPRLGDCAPTAYLELVGAGPERSERLPRASRRRRRNRGTGQATGRDAAPAPAATSDSAESNA